MIKMDIFKRLLYYNVEVEKGRNTVLALPLDRVKLIKEMNLKGQLPDQLPDPRDLALEEEKLDFADDTGDIELPDHKRRKNKKRKNKGGGDRNTQQSQARGDGQGRQQGQRDQRSSQKGPQSQQRSADKPPKAKSDDASGGQHKRRNKNRNRNRGRKPGGERPPQTPPPSS